MRVGKQNPGIVRVFCLTPGKRSQKVITGCRFLALAAITSMAKKAGKRFEELCPWFACSMSKDLEGLRVLRHWLA